MAKTHRIKLTHVRNDFGWAYWSATLPDENFGRGILCSRTIDDMVTVVTNEPLTLCISKKRPFRGLDCLHYKLRDEYTERMYFKGDKQYKFRTIYRGLSRFCFSKNLAEGWIWLEQ